MYRVAKPFIAGLLLLVAATPSPAGAFAFNIQVDTASLAGTDAILAFDFIDGDSTVNNTVQISNFLTDGIFNPASGVGSGDVSGLLDLTVVMGDLSGFNEFLQPITLGNSFQFLLETSNAFAGGTFPDSFSFFILDSNLVPLVATTGGDALFALNLTGTDSGNLSVFASTQPNPPTWSIVPVQNVPEPGGLGLLLIGGGFVYRRKKTQWPTLKKNKSTAGWVEAIAETHLNQSPMRWVSLRALPAALPHPSHRAAVTVGPAPTRTQDASPAQPR